MADIILSYGGVPHSLLATMQHGHQWRYVATRRMAQMGVDSLDDLIRVLWQWHHRAALGVRDDMRRHSK